jgi:hypothetical protein
MEHCHDLSQLKQCQSGSMMIRLLLRIKVRLVEREFRLDRR